MDIEGRGRVLSERHTLDAVMPSPRWQRSMQVQTLNNCQGFILVAEALAQLIEHCAENIIEIARLRQNESIGPYSLSHDGLIAIHDHKFELAEIPQRPEMSRSNQRPMFGAATSLFEVLSWCKQTHEETLLLKTQLQELVTRRYTVVIGWYYPPDGNQGTHGATI